MDVSVHNVGALCLKDYSLATSSWRGNPFSRERALWGCAKELWSYLLRVTRKAAPCSKMGLPSFPHIIRKAFQKRSLTQPLTCPKPSLSRCADAHSPLTTDSDLSRRYHTTSSMKYYFKISILGGGNIIALIVIEDFRNANWEPWGLVGVPQHWTWPLHDTMAYVSLNGYPISEMHGFLSHGHHLLTSFSC